MVLTGPRPPCASVTEACCAKENKRPWVSFGPANKVEGWVTLTHVRRRATAASEDALLADTDLISVAHLETRRVYLDILRVSPWSGRHVRSLLLGLVLYLKAQRNDSVSSQNTSDPICQADVSHFEYRSLAPVA